MNSTATVLPPTGLNAMELAFAAAEIRPPRVKSATKPATTTPPKSARLTLKDQVARVSAGLDSGGVIADINDADDFLADSVSVRKVVEAIRVADAMASRRITTERFNTRKWRSLGLTAILSHVRDWVDHGADAQTRKALNTLEVVQQNSIDVIDKLMLLVNVIVRPADDVGSYHYLRELLEELVGQNVLQKWHNLPSWPRHAILDRRDKNEITGYLPNPERLMAEHGWHYLQEAEARAKEHSAENRRRLAAMELRDTGLTVAEARTGHDGKVFLRVSRNSGATMDVWYNRTVRIVETVGMVTKKTGWIPLNSTREDWPRDEKLWNAFVAWRRS